VRLLRGVGLAAALGLGAGGAAVADEPWLERAKTLEADIQDAFGRVSPAYIVVSGGSGVIISADGWALTNHHVVADRKIGDRWWVRRPGGDAVVAKLIGWDPRGDIALLKLESEESLPFAPLGDSDAVEVGDVALALGNPYGFAWDGHPTATFGIVSSVHNYQNTYSDAIQTDAPINPGNSGGPLLNLKGEVIGINGRVEVRFGNRMNTGVGYAIPSNQIKRFLPRLKVGGTVPHGRISGLYVKDDGAGGRGALVTRIGDKGSAARAGFQRGDVVVGVDDREVTSATSLYSVIGTYPGGAEIEVAVKRGGEIARLKAIVEPYELEAAPSAETPFLGVQLGAPEEGAPEGAVVTSVEPNSPAAKAGLEAGDRVVAFDGTQVRSTEDLVALIRARTPGAEVQIDVIRGDAQLTLTAILGKWSERSGG
jgi:S1-C subfamily serine protease